MTYRGEKRLQLDGKHGIAFDEKKDLVFNNRQKLPFQSNGMRFSALVLVVYPMWLGVNNRLFAEEPRLARSSWSVRQPCRPISS